MKANAHPLVKPIITPRFAPTCSGELLSSLGRIASAEQLPIQSHLSENKDEVNWVRSLFPECANYTDVYGRHGLLTERTIMAHAVLITSPEVDTLVKHGSGVSHCANSNFSLSSGVLDVQYLLSRGVKVGLGTDVAGGYSVSMLDAIRQAIIADRAVRFAETQFSGHTLSSTAASGPVSSPSASSSPSCSPSSLKSTMHASADPSRLDFVEAFYLATRGGAQLIGMEDRLGSFAVDQEFDALVVNPLAPNSPFDVFNEDSLLHIFEKFCFVGDDRNIESVFVSGRQVLPTPAAPHRLSQPSAL